MWIFELFTNYICWCFYISLRYILAFHHVSYPPCLALQNVKIWLVLARINQIDLFWTIALSNSMRTYDLSESVFSNAWEMLLLTVLLCWLWLVSYLKGYIHKVIFSLSCFCLIKISINHKEIRNNDFCDDTRCPDFIFFLFWEFIHLYQQLFVKDALFSHLHPGLYISCPE